MLEISLRSDWDEMLAAPELAGETDSRRQRGSPEMPTLISFHEVDDVDKWLNSKGRDEFFGSRGITVRTFKDLKGTNSVGLILEVPDMSVLEALQTDEAAAAMREDGVRAETLLILEEG